MRPARILLLLIALVAGGLAAFLATRGPSTVVQQVAGPAAPVTSTKVLVAKGPIGVGERLSASQVEWQPWPDNAVRPEYITIAKTPDAPEKLVGAVARFEIFQGEPILDAKLVHSDQGFLSAVLSPGMRGVSVQIAAASGSGGFIIPNDRVDVVVTDTSNGQTTSRVILNDVKVLAIGTRLGQSGATGAPADPNDPKSQVFTSESIATLELTPPQSDLLINATAEGKVSLVLRSVADFASTGPTTNSGPAAPDNQAVRVIRYGHELNVMAGGTAGPEQLAPTINNAAYLPPGNATTTTSTPASTTTSGDGTVTVNPPVTTTITTSTPPGAVPVPVTAPNQ